MNKSRFFKCLMMEFFIIILISLFLFGNIVSAQENFSRPKNLADINIYLEYDQVIAGEEQIITTKIINMGTEEAEDVLLIYTLWDRPQENKISEYSESVAIQTTISNVKRIYIPKGLPNGDYVINVEVEYYGKQASASASFSVLSSKSFFSYERIIIGVGAFISLILLYIVYLLRRSK